MKALIRNTEIITEDLNIPCIDWKTGYPLTNEKWFGGPYTLIENYTPEVENDLDFIQELHEQLIVENPEPIPQDEDEDDEDVVEDDDYVIINGVRYTKEELRKLIE